jgi:histidine ammonia-lyase
MPRAVPSSTRAFPIPSPTQGAFIGIPDVVAVARGMRPVALSTAAEKALAASRARLESVLDDGEAHYGINTGFGSFSRVRISAGDLRDLQRNLIRSHAAGVGEPLPTETVRGMIFLLICSLSRGLSGVRPATVRSLTMMLNKGVHPVVPSIGSCGASGDLAPLAHAVLVLIGEGRAEFRGRLMPGAKALAAAGVRPVVLEAKEGLALINGTHLMAAQGALLMHDFWRLFEAARVAAAMSIDACRATDAFLDDRVHAVGSTGGQRVIAEELRGLLKGSRILPSHRLNDPRVQDPYSLRCAPQVMGAVLELGWYLEVQLTNALQAVSDNPLVFGMGGEGIEGSRDRGSKTEVVSAGNFHGMALAIPLDTMAIGLAHLAGIAERRVYHMLSGFDPETGLPPFLSPAPGLHSGLMIAQYTAAACCNELIGLATPASVANLSTSAGMEDYNAWGPRAAAKARRGLELARNVVAIELLCASEAIEHHRPLRSSPAVERAVTLIRTVVKKLTADRPPSPDIGAIAGLIERGGFAA